MRTLLILLFAGLQFSCSVIVRVNEFGLHEAANFTRHWLHMAVPTARIPDFSSSFNNALASGEMRVNNITVAKFVPPLIRFRPSDHSFVYMNTLSGYAQVNADWQLDSSFLSLLRLPLGGQIKAQMTGLISEIAMQVTPDNDVEVHHCVAQIRDLRLSLKGSMAADLLHWFRTSLTRTIRKRLEEQYCDTMRLHWLPWVEAQLRQFPTNLTISHAPEVTLVQSLHSIAVSQSGIDARMRSDLQWNGTLVESAAGVDMREADIDQFSRSTRMLDIFVDEGTVQSIVAAAHFAGHLKTAVKSPFLKTDCDVLCVGTVLPELQELLPNRTLTVEASTLSPPIVSLQTGKALVSLNASLEVFADPVLSSVNGSLVSITVETEFILTMEMADRKMRGYLNMISAQAVLIDSKIGMMSQKTIDFLVNMSVPFLEDAVDLLLGRGLVVGEPFSFPSHNELLSIQTGCLRYQADLALPEIFARTNF